MPRADPARSPYCASRHLLRNLDDAQELRRNPLVKNLFAPAGRSRNGEHERYAVDRIRRRVNVTLSRLREHAREARGVVRLGRVHAALLRCEIDSQPLAVVAAELGLSERQLRRERQMAHTLFLSAFDRHAQAPHERGRASVAADTAAVRIGEGAELHELGESDLAVTALLGVESGAPAAERRIEAACLGAEIEIDRGRFPEALGRITEAKVMLVARGEELDERAHAVTQEHLDLAEWCLRWRTQLLAGVAARPPRIVAHADAVQAFGGERRRALLVRALTCYAGQRWECGDAATMSAALQRAAAILPTLDAARVKERLAVQFAQARAIGLIEPPGSDVQAFEALEGAAAANGHVRTALAARTERLGSTCEVPRLTDEILNAFGPRERRAMPLAFAGAARIAAQGETETDRIVEAATIAESLAPARCADALLAKCMRVRAALERSALDEAAPLAQEILGNAEAIGNARLRGSAHRYLARIACARGSRQEAVRHTADAMTLLDRFGTYVSRSEAKQLARRFGVN